MILLYNHDFAIIGIAGSYVPLIINKITDYFLGKQLLILHVVLGFHFKFLDSLTNSRLQPVVEILWFFKKLIEGIVIYIVSQ